MNDAHLFWTTAAGITLFVIGLALVALWVVAVMSIVRSRLIEPIVKALWVLAAFTFPIVGPIVWLAVSRYQRRRPGAPTAAVGA